MAKKIKKTISPSDCIKKACIEVEKLQYVQNGLDKIKEVITNIEYASVQGDLLQVSTKR